MTQQAPGEMMVTVTSGHYRDSKTYHPEPESCPMVDNPDDYRNVARDSLKGDWSACDHCGDGPHGPGTTDARCPRCGAMPNHSIARHIRKGECER